VFTWITKYVPFNDLCIDVANTISTREHFIKNGVTDQMLGMIMPFASYSSVTAK
jgi:hypothetical protein